MKTFEHFLSNINKNNNSNILKEFSDFLISENVIKPWMNSGIILSNYKINESFNTKDLVSILTKYTKFLKDNELLYTDVFYKQYKGDFGSLINKFFDKTESYNMMSLTVPDESEWNKVDVNGEELYAINYMDKDYIVRKSKEEWLKDNIGKNIKFKYDKSARPVFIEMPEVMNEKLKGISKNNDHYQYLMKISKIALDQTAVKDKKNSILVDYKIDPENFDVTMLFFHNPKANKLGLFYGIFFDNTNKLNKHKGERDYEFEPNVTDVEGIKKQIKKYGSYELKEYIEQYDEKTNEDVYFNQSDKNDNYLKKLDEIVNIFMDESVGNFPNGEKAYYVNIDLEGQNITCGVRNKNNDIANKITRTPEKQKEVDETVKQEWRDAANDLIEKISEELNIHYTLASVSLKGFMLERSK